MIKNKSEWVKKRAREQVNMPKISHIKYKLESIIEQKVDDDDNENRKSTQIPTKLLRCFVLSNKKE